MSTAYLTIDDAPSADLPEKAVLLEEYDVPAIFFCEGRRLDEYPDHARRAVEAGFHLGNHAYSHRHASQLSIETFREEVVRTESLLQDVYNASSASRPARLFRFPFGDEGGERADAFQDVLAERDFVAPSGDRITYEWYRERHADRHDWFWTVSVEDWAVETRAELRENLEKSEERLAHPSPDVILFHDAGNEPDLFEGFLELLGDFDVEFGEPLGLV